MSCMVIFSCQSVNIQYFTSHTSLNNFFIGICGIWNGQTADDDDHNVMCLFESNKVNLYYNKRVCTENIVSTCGCLKFYYSRIKTDCQKSFIVLSIVSSEILPPYFYNNIEDMHSMHTWKNVHEQQTKISIKKKFKIRWKSCTRL